MKKISLFRFIAISTVFGMILSLSFCKKDTETTTITIHDTLTIATHDTIHINDTLYILVHDTTGGKTISGAITYPDYSGATTLAKGAVVILYFGYAVNPANIVAYTYADASGNYKLPYLLPGPYFIYSKYNTTNKNYRTIEGINFITDPGYPVTMGSTDLAQNLTLVSYAPTGNLKIATDSTQPGLTSFQKVTMETHTKVDFAGMHNGNQQTLQGGFNTCKFTSFVFDEANPNNIVVNAYVLLSTVNTFEPTRDAIASGCVQKTLNVDVDTVAGAPVVMAITDTVRFYSVSVEKYGSGYLVHGKLRGFYKHPVGATRPSTGFPLPADTALGYTGPFNTQIEKDVDLYFEYVSKIKQLKSGGAFNWMMTFEGQFTFHKEQWYISSTSISDEIIVTPHVCMMGTTNMDY